MLRLGVLLLAMGGAPALAGCAAAAARPAQLRPADVVGCYLVSVRGDAEVTGVFPDTVGLDSLPSPDTTGFLGTAIMISQAPRVQLLVWRMIGADSLEIAATVEFREIDMRARLRADGFVGTAAFTDATHTTLAAVTARRSYCVGFGIK